MGINPLSQYAINVRKILSVASNCLDDSVLEERTVGIQMGLELMELCSEVWVFGPPTEGMKFEIAKAEELGITIKFHDQKGQVDYDNH